MRIPDDRSPSPRPLLLGRCSVPSKGPAWRTRLHVPAASELLVIGWAAGASHAPSRSTIPAPRQPHSATAPRCPPSCRRSRWFGQIVQVHAAAGPATSILVRPPPVPKSACDLVPPGSAQLISQTRVRRCPGVIAHRLVLGAQVVSRGGCKSTRRETRPDVPITLACERQVGW